MCCNNMLYYAQHNIIAYNEVFDEFGILLNEDDTSIILLEYCPWCGQKLPSSQREKWFEELEALGFVSPLFDDNIPVEYKSKKWREKS